MTTTSSSRPVINGIGLTAHGYSRPPVDSLGLRVRENGVDRLGFRAFQPSVARVGFRAIQQPNGVGQVGFRTRQIPTPVDHLGFRVRQQPDRVDSLGFRVKSTAEKVDGIGFRAKGKAPLEKLSPQRKIYHLVRDRITVALALINSVGEYLYQRRYGLELHNMKTAWEEFKLTFFQTERAVHNTSKRLNNDQVRAFDGMVRRAVEVRKKRRDVHFNQWIFRPHLENRFSKSFPRLQATPLPYRRQTVSSKTEMTDTPSALPFAKQRRA